MKVSAVSLKKLDALNHVPTSNIQYLMKVIPFYPPLVSGPSPMTHMWSLRFSFDPDPMSAPNIPPSSTLILGSDLPSDFLGGRVWWSPRSLPWIFLHDSLGRGGEASRLEQDVTKFWEIIHWILSCHGNNLCQNKSLDTFM